VGDRSPITEDRGRAKPPIANYTYTICRCAVEFDNSNPTSPIKKLFNVCKSKKLWPSSVGSSYGYASDLQLMSRLKIFNYNKHNIYYIM